MKKGFRIIKFKKNKPIFQIRDISKSFDGRPILKKISMEMNAGEIVGLLGPNGSGKSTLYSIIIGEHQAESGKIYINNKDVSEKPIHERAKMGIGYLSQQRSVFAMSVYDNLLGICQLSIKGSQNQVCKELVLRIEKLQLAVFDQNRFKCQSSLLGLQSEIIEAYFFKNFSNERNSFMIPYVIKNC